MYESPNQCAKQPAALSSPYKERDDHKCSGPGQYENFECFGYRVCGSANKCIDPCSAQYSGDFRDIETYPAEA